MWAEIASMPRASNASNPALEKNRGLGWGRGVLRRGKGQWTNLKSGNAEEGGCARLKRGLEGGMWLVELHGAAVHFDAAAAKVGLAERAVTA